MNICSGAALLLVDFEARQIYLESYTRCFESLKGAVYINFSMDILRIESSLPGLRSLIPRWPWVMEQVQQLEVSILRKPAQQYVLPEKKNFHRLSACKCITVTQGRRLSGYMLAEHRILEAVEDLRSSLLIPGESRQG